MRLAVIVAAALVASSGTAAAQTPAIDAGVIWQGKQAGLGLAEVAAIAAPVLWFSASEPFIADGDHALPHVHPCDAPAGGGVVYYQVVRISLRGGDKVGWPPQDDPFFVDRVESFTLRYHFYFKRDFAGTGLLHDLESVDLDIALDRLADAGYRIRITRVAGLTRGSEWNANELVVVPGTTLPITLLVEKGTHVVGPDRNADGLFTLGHDINRRIPDAWGVRDVEVGTRVSDAYDASMFTPRLRGYRMLPPAVPRIAADGSPITSVASASGELGRYELRPGSAVPACATPPSDDRRLRVLTRDRRFGPEAEPEQYRTSWMRDVMRPLSGTDPLIRNVSIHRDRGMGGAVQFRGLDFLEGSLMPRVTFAAKRVSLEGLFTPTSTRFLGWYGSAGVLRDRHDWNFVAEAGLKFRIRVRGSARIFTLGSDFAGLRVGVRTSGFDRLSPIRFVTEIGIGGW